MTIEMTFVADAAAATAINADHLSITRTSTETAMGTVSGLRYLTTASPHTGPPLLLLHGGGQNAHTWDLTMAASQLPAIALDLPGHGASHWLADHDYSPRRLTASITAAAAALCPDTEVVVGMSLGGMVALTVAEALPRLRALVLVDVSPGSTVPPGVSFENLRARTAMPFEALVERLSAGSPGRPLAGVRHGVWHATEAAAGGRRWRNDPDARVGSFLDLWHELETYAPVTTEVLASRGSFVPEQDRRRLGELLGDRLVQVPDAGHSVQNTQPQRLAAILAGVV